MARTVKATRFTIGEWMPLLMFGVTYVLTCLLGAVLMLLQYAPFVELYEFFSGTAVPVLAGSELISAVLLLFAAPAFVLAGYWVGLRFTPRSQRPPRKELSAESHFVRAQVFFWVCAAGGIVSLLRSGSLANVGAWTDYATWIEARASGFDTLSFFEFVNLYLFVPFAAAWVLVERPPLSQRYLGVLVRIVPALVAVGFSLLLFQRKAAVVTLLIVTTAAFVKTSESGRRVRRRAVATLVAALAVLYVSTVIVPVYSGASDAKIESESVTITNSKVAIGLYAALSPITRTAAPALFYPAIFPDERRFYGLDVGQDVLGVGSMPDDNIVVWQVMNPEINGTTAAPFQFAFYSQVGILRTLLLCATTGVLLAASWRLARHPRLRVEWRALAGALVLLWSVYLAIDSMRNSTLVSYGVLWGLVFLASAFGISTLSSGRKRPKRDNPRVAVSLATADHRQQLHGSHTPS